MKFWLRVLISGLILLMVVGCSNNVEYGDGSDTDTNNSSSTLSPSDQVLKALFDGNISDFQIQGSGTVTKILADSSSDANYQQFNLKLASGQMLLINHNIDIATRIETLTVGDSVEFNGEYDWTSGGGKISYTYKDPDDNHVDGWLKHEGVVYQ